MNVVALGGPELRPEAVAAARAEIARNAERLAAEAARKRVQRHIRKGGVLVREVIPAGVRWISATRAGEPFDTQACETLLVSARLAAVPGSPGLFRGTGCSRTRPPDLSSGPRRPAEPDMSAGPLFSGEELPPIDGRWTARKKRLVLDAISRGLISPIEALERYSLSGAELRGWRAALRQHGPSGLAAKRMRELRP